MVRTLSAGTSGTLKLMVERSNVCFSRDVDFGFPPKFDIIMLEEISSTFSELSDVLGDKKDLLCQLLNLGFSFIKSLLLVGLYV